MEDGEPKALVCSHMLDAAPIKVILNTILHNLSKRLTTPLHLGLLLCVSAREEAATSEFWHTCWLHGRAS